MAKQKSKKSPPDGWEDVEPTLSDFEQKMISAQLNTESIVLVNQKSWPISKLNYAKSRYIYELFYKTKTISRELYNWLLDNKYGDRILIAKWKKAGFERLCCIRCAQTAGHSFGTTCICRVPHKEMEKSNSNKPFYECITCGCHGCS